MKHTFQRAAQMLLAVPALALMASAVVGLQPAYAADCSDANSGIIGSASCAQGSGQPSELATGDNSVFKTVTNVLLFIIGAVSVIMLVIGGIRYTISGGDSNQVTSAKNTILYAIVGIIVAILAYAAVDFVIANLASTD